jgi:hypothetical protein
VWSSSHPSGRPSVGPTIAVASQSGTSGAEQGFDIQAAQERDVETVVDFTKPARKQKFHAMGLAIEDHPHGYDEDGGQG